MIFLTSLNKSCKSGQTPKGRCYLRTTAVGAATAQAVAKAQATATSASSSHLCVAQPNARTGASGDGQKDVAAEVERS
jgi:hypothetical protein